MDDIFESNLNESFFSCSSSNTSFDSAHSDVSSALTLHDHLSSLFSNFQKNLNVAHINIQSIPRHHSDLLASISSDHLDALLISESFLKPSLPSSLFALPGFVLIRNDRIGKGCGGVAVYLRDDIPFKIISASPSIYSDSAEYLFIEITVQHSKILLGVFYSPNLRVNYFDTLDTLLSDLCTTYSRVVLMGDFNTCLIKNDHRTRSLSSLLSSFNLHILPLSATHHFPNCTPSLLDLIIVSTPDLVATHGQLTASFSYHDLIFLSFSIRSPKRRSQFSMVRNFKSMNLEALRQDAGNINWTPVIDSLTIDEKVACFTDSLTALYNQHAPKRRVKLKRLPCPWITPAIKEVMASRDKAKRRYKRSPTDFNFNRFKILRNRCSRLCRDAKRRHFHQSLDTHNSSKVWKFLKDNGIGKSPIIDCNDIDLRALNIHFSLPPVTLDPLVKSRTLLDLSLVPLPRCPPFILAEVNEDEVKKSLIAITSSAVGNDQLCSKMFTPILPTLTPILTHIFNFSLYSGCFPCTWKQALIIPLPKTSNPTLLSQFRPISILPFLSKVLEHIVHRQLSSYLTQNNLLSPFQSGFRPGHSTVTALLKVTDDIRRAMENKLLTVIVLLDFSSAFNSVDFDVLLGILRSLNFSAETVAWFDSYLRGRSQCVRHKESYSEWRHLSAGVPQGGVLSPLLFSIFINSAVDNISSNFHLYADDLQLYRHFSLNEIRTAIAAMNSDLNGVSQWARSFGLQINPKKSQAIIIGSRQMRNGLDLASLPPILLDDMPIAYSNTVKNLGVIMDGNLSWKAHIGEVSKKVHYTFHTLKCLQGFLPLKTKITIAQTLLQPILDYADSCYLDATEEQLNKLERLQNLCIRFIFNLRKYDHISQFRKDLKWLPIRLRRNTRILCLLYNILHNPSYPSYLRERFSFISKHNDPCRSHLKFRLTCPSHKTDFYSYSFSVHAVRLWNCLPPTIQGCKSIALFKKRVKEHFLSSSP